MKTRLHPSTVTMFCLLVVSVTMGVPPAYAGTEVYPAAMCVKWSSGGTPNYSFGSIRNTSSTSTLSLDCPAVHDPGPNDVATIQSGWVRVTDQHFSQDICCTLTVVDHSGSGFDSWWGGPKCSVGSSPNVQHLDFGAVWFNPSDSLFSHYYYSCHIPPTYNGQLSYIHTYSIDE
jgi:hypothetical protein